MKKKEKKKCSGLTDKRIQCRTVMDKNTTYCKKHEHFKDFTDEEINKIKTETEINTTVCNKCKHWRKNSQFINESGNNVDRCDICRKKDADYREEQKIKKAKLKCEWYEKNKKRKTKKEDNEEDTKEDNEEEIKQKKPCRFNKINGTDYCKNHQFVCDYTDDMKKDVVQCSDCGHWKYIEYGTIKGKYQRYKLCEKCINRGKNNREKDKEKKKDDPKCDHYGCFRPPQNNGYCKKHIIDFLRIEALKKGNRLCEDGKRGCQTELDKDYPHSKCRYHLDKDNEGERTRKDKIKGENNSKVKNNNMDDMIKENNEKSNNYGSEYKVGGSKTDETDDIKIEGIDYRNVDNDDIDDSDIDEEDSHNNDIPILQCISCPKKGLLIDFINGKGDLGHKCQDCLRKQREKDKKRDRSDRDYKEYESQPHVKARHKKWNKDNPEKSALYSMNYRNQQIKKLGEEEYLRRKAKYAEEWRKKNPDKQQKYYDDKKVNIWIRYCYYKRRAKKKGKKY
jgi:hypothetical protein